MKRTWQPNKRKRAKIRDLNKNDIVSNLDELDEKINNCF